MEHFKTVLEEHLEELKRHYTNLIQFQERFLQFVDCEDHAKRGIVKLDQEELKGFKIGIEECKKIAQNLCQCLSKIQSKLSEFGLEPVSEFKEGYKEKLWKTLEQCKGIARESREKGNKNLIEWNQQLDQSDQKGRKIFNIIKILAVDLGTELSQILVEYFLFFAESEPEGVARRLELMKSTIRSESLGENSVVIDRFISVVELIERNMKNRPECKGKCVKNFEANAFDRASENHFLGTIFFGVFHLETSFLHPLFPKLTAKNEVLLAVANEILNSLMSKLKETGLMINTLKTEFALIRGEDPRLKKFKEMLDMAIEEIWNGLSL